MIVNVTFLLGNWQCSTANLSVDNLVDDFDFDENAVWFDGQTETQTGVFFHVYLMGG